MGFAVIDGHNDLPWAHREEFEYDLDRGDLLVRRSELHTDLPRLAAGGVVGQFWSVYVPSNLPEPQAVVATLEQIDFVHRIASRYEELALARTADELDNALACGRLACLLGVEGGHSIGSSLGVLRQLFALGARYMTLTHNDNTKWADSATDVAKVGGLSPFGREVVAEMNRLGMMVDLSHVADSTMYDVLDCTTAPVIFSHSNARALCSVPRNVPDEVLSRVPANGGLVMATFVPYFTAQPVGRWMTDAIEWAQTESKDRGTRVGVSEALRGYSRIHPPPRSTIDDVVAQLEYLRDAVGVEHLGLGGDFDGSAQVTVGLDDVSSYPNLFNALLERGWSSDDVESVAGKNVMRVMRDVEGVAGLG